MSPHVVSKVGLVYLVVNKINGKKYVGCTKLSLKQRWMKHLGIARRGSPFAIHAAIRKYGAEHFVVEVIEEVEGTHDDLMAAEIRQIALHDCASPKGYNLTLGGEGVDHSIPEVRERHIAANRKNYADPVWVQANLEGARRRSANPEWQKNTAEANRLQAFDPAWQEAHRQGCAKRNVDPVYLEALSAGIRRRSADPKWREVVTIAAHKRAQDPSWVAANQEGARKRADSSTWRENQLAAMRLVHADPEWQASVTAANRKKAQDPQWLEKNREGHRKRVAAIEAKWALLPAEELEKRLKRRESSVQYRAAKKALLRGSQELETHSKV